MSFELFFQWLNIFYSIFSYHGLFGQFLKQVLGFEVMKFVNDMFFVSFVFRMVLVVD